MKKKIVISVVIIILLIIIFCVKDFFIKQYFISRFESLGDREYYSKYIYHSTDGTARTINYYNPETKETRSRDYKVETEELTDFINVSNLEEYYYYELSTHKIIVSGKYDENIDKNSVIINEFLNLAQNDENKFKFKGYKTIDEKTCYVFYFESVDGNIKQTMYIDKENSYIRKHDIQFLEENPDAFVSREFIVNFDVTEEEKFLFDLDYNKENLN